MEAIKIKKKIKSSTLVIEELEKFKGREVEIIIISPPIKNYAAKGSRKINNEIKVGGLLEKYKNPKLISKEKSAWAIAVYEKYANS